MGHILACITVALTECNRFHPNDASEERTRATEQNEPLLVSIAGDIRRDPTANPIGRTRTLPCAHRHYTRLFAQPQLKDADAAGWPGPLNIAVAGRRGGGPALPPAFPD